MSNVWQILIIPLLVLSAPFFYHFLRGFIEGARTKRAAPVQQEYTYTTERAPEPIPTPATAKEPAQSSVYQDAVSVLISLGFKRSDAKAAVSIAAQGTASHTTEGLVKKALSKISGGA